MAKKTEKDGSGGAKDPLNGRSSKRRRVVVDLEDHLDAWLARHDHHDAIRAISVAVPSTSWVRTLWT